MDFIHNPFLLVTKDLTDIQKSSDTLPPKPCVSLGNFSSDVLVHMCACVCGIDSIFFPLEVAFRMLVSLAYQVYTKS